ncbi:hypothetical protein LC593_24315 [Nostoc sp. CHAB 5844]|nr:hypothetical protein [Nostoc sp. CHAB 5844]
MKYDLNPSLEALFLLSTQQRQLLQVGRAAQRTGFSALILSSHKEIHLLSAR